MLFIVLFLVSGCSTVTQVELFEKKAPAKKITFLPEKEIKDSFLNLSEAKQMEDRLSPEAVKRLELLQPDEAFITPEHLKELHDAIRNKSYTKSTEQRDTAPKSVDRRNCDTRVVNQIGGSCTSHAITNAMDNLFCKPTILDASNEDLWNKYKKYSTWTGIQAATNNKICEEKYFPNGGSRSGNCAPNSHIKLTSYDYIANDIDKARAYLDQGIPLVYSGKVTRSWSNCDSMIDPNSSPTGGGHAVLTTGYRDVPDMLGGGYFIIKNSWGTRCGDKGYQYLPYHYLNRTDNGMYGFFHAIKKISTKYDDPNVQPDPDNVVCRKVRNCEWHFLICWKWGPWKEICD